MMQGWSQEDYDERKQRQNDGIASDEDRRLIKMYEQQGFTQSRVKDWDAAAERAKAATAGAGARDPGEPVEVKRPATNDKREDWVTWAQLINEGLSPDTWPIAVPADAKKDELVAFYKDLEPRA